jgi:receptor protein-tyrosine kinase
MSQETPVEFVETSVVLGQRPPVQAAALSSDSVVSEEFRYLAACVRSIAKEKRLGRIGVVSAVSGEGKTTVTLGLAAALAQETSRRVLVVEGDLRKPMIEQYLGLPRTPGVSEWLSGSADEVAIRQVAPPGFRVLSAGLSPFDNPSLLASERMERLLASAQRAFGYVLVDCSPLTPVADAVAMQELLDGFLLVVRARHAPREALSRAATRIKPERVLGMVMTEAREVLPSNYSYSYRRYRRGSG